MHLQVFTNSYERQLDPKGRVALPAAYRPRFEPRCFVTLGQDKCLGVLTAETSAEVLNELLAAVKRGERSMTELRVLAATMTEVAVDAQGRITLDEKLRAYAGLQPGEKVIVAGAVDRIEIWEPSRFERLSAEGTEAIAGVRA